MKTKLNFSKVQTRTVPSQRSTQRLLDKYALIKGDDEYLFKRGYYKNWKLEQVRQFAEKYIFSAKSQIFEDLEKSREKIKYIEDLKKWQEHLSASNQSISFHNYAQVRVSINEYGLLMKVSDSLTKNTIKEQMSYERWLNENFFHREILYAFVYHEQVVLLTELQAQELFSKKATRGKRKGSIHFQEPKAGTSVDLTNWIQQEFKELKITSDSISVKGQAVKYLTKQFNAALRGIMEGDDEKRISLLKHNSNEKTIAEADRAERLVEYAAHFSGGDTNFDNYSTEHDWINGLLKGDIGDITKLIKDMLSESNQEKKFKNLESISIAVKNLSSWGFQTESISPSILFASYIIFAKEHNKIHKGTDFVPLWSASTNEKYTDYTELFEAITSSNKIQQVIDKMINEVIK